MGIRTVKPTSAARRYLTYVTYEEITKKEPEKGLVIPKRRTNGRNAYGRITVRHRGGGAKRMLREVDFRRDKTGIPARVAAIEYDPNRSARLALLHYRDGEKRYIIAPLGIKVDDVVMSGPQADILPGNALPIRLKRSTGAGEEFTYAQRLFQPVGPDDRHAPQQTRIVRQNQWKCRCGFFVQQNRRVKLFGQSFQPRR